MRKKLSAQLSIEDGTSGITWLTVAGSALYLMWDSGDYSHAELFTTGALYVLFMVFWQMGIREEPYSSHDTRVRCLLIVAEFLTVIAIYFQVPYTYTAILITIWSAQLPYYMSLRTAVLLSPLWSAPQWLIYSQFWGRDYVFLSSLLFWTFNLFALAMVNAMLKEQKARQAANDANRELMATQALLNEATKQAERVRIARNIHDLLGHHLTALTINLQIASRLSDGQVREKISQCHSLAKLLLSDVREAVSEIREKSNLQLQDALQSLIDDIPQLDVELRYPDELKIDDVTIATTLLRCVQECLTNSLKHSNANHFSIVLESRDNTLLLKLHDNGSNAKQVTLGNGLKGIQERVRALGGSVQFLADHQGFTTHVSIPEPVCL